jgi:hypothetical protein
MAALGELFVLAIYIFLGLSAAAFLFLTFYGGLLQKIWMTIGCIFFSVLFYVFWSHMNKIQRKAELEQVGVYYLTAYPNCEYCVLELKKDLTYDVRNNGQIIEKSDWHYKSGGDYWITYLDGKNHQLGNGYFEYERSELRDGE